VTQTRISIALSEKDLAAMEVIKNYLETNRPDTKVGTTDVIRYALIMAAVAIQKENSLEATK
jgi:hypothetical protein